MKVESDIFSSWGGDCYPVVSLVCISYNHVEYVEQALRGFLLQETDFPYEIICYDDYSVDGTRDVIDKLALQYPKLIRTIFPDENKYSKGYKPVQHVFPLCRGKYIALCEGDDYWTDPIKVQTQVDFLQNNPDYVVVTHDIIAINEKGVVVNRGVLSDFYKKDFTSYELRCGWAGVVTQAMLYRNVFEEFPHEYQNVYLEDVFLASILGQYGHSKFIDNIKPSMYRLHQGGIFSPLNISDRYDVQMLSFFWIYKYYKRIGLKNEERVFKLKFLEKGLRNIGFYDFFRLLFMRFFRFNIKKTLNSR